MKIAMHYAHYETLGHTMRTMALARELVKSGDEVVIFNAGKPQDDVWEGGIKVINLPYHYVDKEQFKGINKEVRMDNIKKRISFMKDYLKSFNPDVFVVEFFPFGRKMFRQELLPLLVYLKKEKVKIISSVGYPILGLRLNEVKNYMKYFDKILLHCPQDMDSKYILKRVKDLGIKVFIDTYDYVLNSLTKEMLSTGYIINKEVRKSKEQIRSELNLKGEKLILVSRGGGVICPKVITHSILAKNSIGDDFFMLVVAGPASSEDEMELFTKLASKFKGVRVVKYLPNLIDYLNAADVSISMGGYNTCMQTAFLGKKAILIPLDVPGRDPIEQHYRCIMLKEILGSKVLNYDSFSGKEIATNIQELIRESEPTPLNLKFFNGAKVSCDKIHNLNIVGLSKKTFI